MNEPAIRMEEQIISLFPGMETLICHGWILKKMERHEKGIGRHPGKGGTAGTI